MKKYLGFEANIMKDFLSWGGAIPDSFWFIFILYVITITITVSISISTIKMEKGVLGIQTRAAGW